MQVTRAVRNRIHVVLLGLTTMGFVVSVQRAHDLPKVTSFVTPYGVYAPQFSTDGHLVSFQVEPRYSSDSGPADVFNRHSVALWDWTTRQPVWAPEALPELQGFPVLVGGARASSLLITGRDSVTRFSLPSGRPSGRLPGVGLVTAHTRDGRFLAGIDRGALKLLELATGRRRTLIPAPKEGGGSRSWQIVFSDDGSELFATDSGQGGPKCFDTRTGRSLPLPDALESAAPVLIAPSPDGTMFAVYGKDGMVRFFSAIEGMPSAAARGVPLEVVSRLSWLDGGRFLVAEGINHEPVPRPRHGKMQVRAAAVWDLSGAGRDYRFLDLERSAGRFGREGWALVSDRRPSGMFPILLGRKAAPLEPYKVTTRLIDLRSGREWTVPGIEGSYFDCAFSADNRILVTVSRAHDTRRHTPSTRWWERRVTVWQVPERR